MLALLHIATPAAAQGDTRSTARAHFEAGVAAFADKRFGEAAEEFETAYRLEPAFVVLYNIGQVDVALGRSVEAVDAFDKYLKQGASAIPAARRREVNAEIGKQSARVGTVTIRTVPDAAEVRVDGRLLGRPLLGGPVRMNAGKHTVEAMLVGYTTKVRELEVVGRTEISVELTLDTVVATAAPSTGAVVPIAPPPGAVATPPMPTSPDAPPLSSSSSSRASEATRTSSSGHGQRILGVVVAIAGLAAATTGGVLAYQGANKANDARNRKTTTNAEYTQATNDFNAGKTRNRDGWIVAGIGGAVLLGGALLVATAPEATNAVSLAPWVTVAAGGVVMTGAW